jgi:hypothetical protein
MSEEIAWQRLLRDALAVLALSPDEQIRANGPGCVACDLLNDFDIARMAAIGNAPSLSQGQRQSLDQIDATMRTMEELDFVCFDNKVLHRPVWQQLRELAADALWTFGWEEVTVQPFVEVQKGVWKRPLSDI